MDKYHEKKVKIFNTLMEIAPNFYKVINLNYTKNIRRTIFYYVLLITFMNKPILIKEKTLNRTETVASHTPLFRGSTATL